MLNRRRFLQSLAIAASSPALSIQSRADDAQVGMLRPDPERLLDLPAGYSHHVVSRAGERMSDGLIVPGYHDGMAAFPGNDGRIILVCNHENSPADGQISAFADGFDALPGDIKEKFYDQGSGITPGAGGTTTTIFNPLTGKTERQHLSLAGTELNCSGGPTPWGSWLSCEECFELPGFGLTGGRVVTRNKSHGYVFEVPAGDSGLAQPRPIKAMGKFKREAATVHEPSGVVYLTEDRQNAIFYRYIPDVPGQLHAGGRLQGLGVKARPSIDTRNWKGEPAIRIGDRLQTYWIDLDDIDGDTDDLRLRGAKKGAALFGRSEDMCAAGEDIVFTCTIGGPDRLGQVFAYRPSRNEGKATEADAPGQLRLIAESTQRSLLRNADNITMAPWGDLVACEDTASHCGIVGIRPDGSQYQIADNAYTNSELAGICFSPDGETMFVNIQEPGMTLAIKGPWPG